MSAWSDQDEWACRALALSPYAVLALDAKGVVVHASPAAEAMLSRGAAELAGTSIDALLPAPSDAAEATSARLRALHGEDELELAFVPEGRQGHWLALRVRPVGALRAVYLEDRTSERLAQLEVEQVVSAARGAIFTLDAEARVVEANPAAHRLLGAASGELVGLPLAASLSVDPRALARDAAPVTTRVRRRDGSEVAAELVVLHGERGACCVILRDTSERDDMLARLADSEAEFREVFQSVPIGLWVVRIRDFVVVDANDAVLKLGERQREEVVGQPLSALASDERGRQLAELVRAGQQLEDVPHRLELRSGGVRHLRLTTRMYEVGDEPYMLLLVADVTARWEAEQSRARTAERFRELAAGIREVLYFSDPVTGKLSYVSPAYADIWGAPLGDDPDTFRAAWRESIHPEDRERVTRDLIARQVRGDFDERYRIVRPDGSVRWVHSRAFPVRGENGEVVRIVGVAEDITRRRELETQLQQAQKMESLGRLAGGVAHDFNNWLTVITGNVDLMEPDAPDGDAREILQEVRAATERASGLTRQLLAFSRQDVVEKRPTDLNEVVRDTMKMLRRMLGEEITVETHLGAGIGCVFADPGQMVQIAMNLAVNARDAMPAGGRIAIATSAETVSAVPAASPDARPGRYVVLEVRDTGSGMTPEVRRRIFEPFFTTKGVGRGTGLGLAVVQGIVGDCGGFVTVESVVGEGSTFAVHLPEDERPTQAGAVQDEAANEARPGETVLVVEDEDSVRRVAVRALRAAGFQVLEAGSGEEALAALSAAPRVDLLLTDVVMPRMDGARVASSARTLSPSTKVLYTSGYTGDAVVRHGISTSSVAFLAKPYTRLSLLRKVRELLDG